jgi:hypothetical protein
MLTHYINCFTGRIFKPTRTFSSFERSPIIFRIGSGTFPPVLEWRISGRLPLTVDVPTNRSLQFYIAPLNGFRNIFEDFVKQLLTWVFCLRHITAVPMFLLFCHGFIFRSFVLVALEIPFPVFCGQFPFFPADLLKLAFSLCNFVPLFQNQAEFR